MKTDNVQTINQRLQDLASKTKANLADKNIEAARNYISQVEKEYHSGDKHLRNLIANIYIFSVSTYLECHDLDLFNLFPLSFIKEYYSQVNASGL
jgi:hypothetical protein